MDTDMIAPALEAGLNALRNAGISGMPRCEALALAGSILDDEWEARGLNEAELDEPTRQWWGSGASDALMASYTKGLRERVRGAIAQCILDVRTPVNVQLCRDPGTGAYAWDDTPVDHLPLRDIEFDDDWAERFIEVAASAADLPPEEIVSIVAEFCPILDREHAAIYAGFELRTYHGSRARSRFVTPKPEPEVMALAEREAVPAVAAPTFDLEHEPGLLGDIARWSQTYAFRPVREFALPVAIAVGAAIFGRRVITPTGLGLNLYQIAIADTGGGKDALLGAAKALLSKAGFRHLIGPGDFSSDAALETSLRMHPGQLMPLDEFGKLAQAMMGRNAPSFAKLAAKALLEVYPRSHPGSEWTGKQKADPARDNASEPVHSPTLSILAVSTPEGFFEGMSQQTLDDGFLNRLTLIRGGAAGPRQRDTARLVPPADLIKRLQDAYAASAPAGDLTESKARSATAEPAFRFARWADDDAIRAIEEVEAWEDAAGDEGRRGVTGRAAEQTQKIATIRAAFRDPADPAVTAEDVRWAFAMVKSSIETIEEGARSMMAGSEFETLCNDIMAALEKAGMKGLPMSVLLRAKGVAKARPRDVDDALKRLEQTHRIFLNVGRPGRVRMCFDGERIEQD